MQKSTGGSSLAASRNLIHSMRWTPLPEGGVNDQPLVDHRRPSSSTQIGGTIEGKDSKHGRIAKEGKMELTADVRTVLDIVRRVLRARTDWITQGQVLMEAIVSEVEKHPARTP